MRTAYACQRLLNGLRGVPEPAVSSISAATSDILPTLCKLAGTKLPNVPLDGIDLVPLLKGEMKKRSKPIAFWNFPVETSQDGRPYRSRTTKGNHSSGQTNARTLHSQFQE